MISFSNSPSRGSGTPNQVNGAFLRAPCPVPSCPAYEPNCGSVLSSVSTKTHSSQGADTVMRSSHPYGVQPPKLSTTCLNSAIVAFKRGCLQECGRRLPEQ